MGIGAIAGEASLGVREKIYQAHNNNKVLFYSLFYLGVYIYLLRLDLAKAKLSLARPND